MLAHPLQLFKKCPRILHVFDRVGAQHVIELLVGEGMIINVDLNEVRDVRMLNDIRVDASAVGFPTTHIQIPYSSF